jgi:putative FmdB family regulatory protein
MPFYEYRCETCEAREEVFSRSVGAKAEAPVCNRCKGKPVMVRAISKFARHLTEGDKLAEAEAKFGKEVDAAMGPQPDIGRMARRYERLAKDLPPDEK